MAEQVCCPQCWTWQLLGKKSVCSRCGTPLIHATGQAVGEAPPPPTATPMMAVRAGVPQPVGRFDWLLVARLYAGVSGLIGAAVLAAEGFRDPVQQVFNPGTGTTDVVQLGPAYGLAALFALIFTAVAVWLLTFRTWRLISMVVSVCGALLLAFGVTTVALSGVGRVVLVVLEAGYGAVLGLSLQRRTYR